jgi:hypothetical protein
LYVDRFLLDQKASWPRIAGSTASSDPIVPSGCRSPRRIRVLGRLITSLLRSLRTMPRPLIALLRKVRTRSRRPGIGGRPTVPPMMTSTTESGTSISK